MIDIFTSEDLENKHRGQDPVQETTFIEGRTTEIFVSRLNIYEDGMDEIILKTAVTRFHFTYDNHK